MDGGKVNKRKKGKLGKKNRLAVTEDNQGWLGGVIQTIHWDFPGPPATRGQRISGQTFVGGIP